MRCPQSGQLQLAGACSRITRGSSDGSTRGGRGLVRLPRGLSTDTNLKGRGGSDGICSGGIVGVAPPERGSCGAMLASITSEERPKRQRLSRITSSLSASTHAACFSSSCLSSSASFGNVAYSSATTRLYASARVRAALLHRSNMHLTRHDVQWLLLRALGSSPVDPLKQHRQLRWCQMHRARARSRPHEAPALEALREQTQPIAVGPEHFCFVESKFNVPWLIEIAGVPPPRPSVIAVLTFRARSGS